MRILPVIQVHIVRVMSLQWCGQNPASHVQGCEGRSFSKGYCVQVHVVLGVHVCGLFLVILQLHRSEREVTEASQLPRLSLQVSVWWRHSPLVLVQAY